MLHAAQGESLVCDAADGGVGVSGAGGVRVCMRIDDTRICQCELAYMWYFW